METSERFIDHYKNGFMPWVHEEPDFNIVDVVTNWPIKPCKMLEIGCGTGVDSIWFSQQKFDISAIDISPIAINLAKENALAQKANVDFKVFDFINDQITPEQYGFVFDRGFLHSFEDENERKEVVNHISNVLEKDGLWLSLIGNADGVKTDPGPPLRSARQIVNAIEPFFRILNISASYFGNDEANPAKIWVCLMRKR